MHIFLFSITIKTFGMVRGVPPWNQVFQLDMNTLLYTPKASAELLSAGATFHTAHCGASNSSRMQSQHYVTVATHKGKYRYPRMPYGVSSAQRIFQSVMDQILRGIDNMMCFLDDIFITAESEQEIDTH